MSEPVVVDPEQIADVLEAAAADIEMNGLHQGAAFSPVVNESTGKPSRCLIGAVTHEGSMRALYRNRAPLVGAAIDALNEVLSDPVGWNDSPGREAWEVTDLLRTTAKKVRAGDIEVGA